jgi:hypothetical protein
MRHLVGGLLAVSLVFPAARWVNAACELTQDQQNAARGAADAACDQEGRGCTTASSHGQYVSCIAQKVKADPSLSDPHCRGAIKRCAARSICGKQSRGFQTCCKTSSDGTTKCSIKSSTSACTDHPPPGGSACAGADTHPSCCDACTSSGCAP